MTLKDIYRLQRGIKRDIKNVEEYHTGLLGEALIVASYKQMTIQQLESMQFIIGKILKQKKEMKRVQEATNAKTNDIVNSSNTDIPNSKGV